MKTGTPSGCQVTVSSGDADLDSPTCSLFQKRAEFKPATESDRTSYSRASLFSEGELENSAPQPAGFQTDLRGNFRTAVCQGQMVKYDFQA